MTSVKSALPQARHWDHYWSLDQTEKFTKISWSKRRILQILKSYVVKNNKVLDAGCGSGFFAKYFYDQGMQASALDYSQQALDLTSSVTQGRVMLFKKDLRLKALPEEITERFDLIFSDGLLEHFSIEDQYQIMHNFFSLLKKGGILATFVPNRFSPWEIIRPIFMPGIEETPFILKQLIKLNTQQALTILEQGGINTLPFRFSPDRFIGHIFGMHVFTVAQKNA